MPSVEKQKHGKGPVKLVNRGGAGLLSKPKKSEEANGQAEAPAVPKGKVDNIRCAGDVVKISSLAHDPMNARVHGDRNLQSIKDSLNLYGQMVPLVVRKKDRVVVAGNGRLDAAKAEGWTMIAVNFVDLTPGESAGYGLADNRTAELARWNFEVVAQLDKLMQECGLANVGWSSEELIALRIGEWEDEKPKYSPPQDYLECPECGHLFPIKNPSKT